MGYQIATLGLAPILVAQGRYVRRVTPRLPEASGARSGTQGLGPRLRLLIAGDSAAAGVGVLTQADALCGNLVSELSRDFRVSWQLRAQTGLAARDLVEQLERAAAETFDVVLLSVGVNDATGRTAIRDWRMDLARMVVLLRVKFGARHILLTSLPPMHLFPALPQPLRWYLGTRARQLDLELRKVAQADAQCLWLAPQLPVTGDAIAADGFHPGAPAYAAWARTAAAAIRDRCPPGHGQTGRQSASRR